MHTAAYANAATSSGDSLVDREDGKGRALTFVKGETYSGFGLVDWSVGRPSVRSEAPKS